MAIVRELGEEVGLIGSEEMFRGEVFACRRVQYAYFILMKQVDEFERVTCLGGAVYTVK